MTEKLKRRYEEHLTLLIERGYIPIENEEEYIAMTSKIEYICPKHKDKGIQKIDYHHLKDGRGCYHCGRERTIAARTITITNDIINEAKELCDKNNFTYVDLYKDNEQQKFMISFVCNNHKEFGVQQMGFHNMKRDIKGCKYCAHKQLPEWYIRDLISQKSPHITIQDSFTKLTQKVTAHCNIHNYDYITTPQYILQGSECEYCRIDKIAKANTLSQKKAQERVTKANPTIQMTGEYTGQHNKTEFTCLKCGYSWIGSVMSMFTNGTNCPKCGKNIYKGEARLEEILQKHNINYQRQYAIENCKDNKSLPFDFAIFDSSKQLVALCEYDGEQHYRPVDFSGDKLMAKEQFKKTKKHDEIKNTYCKENNIPLIRIPYYEYNNMELFLIKKIIENNILIDTTD